MEISWGQSVLARFFGLFSICISYIYMTQYLDTVLYIIEQYLINHLECAVDHLTPISRTFEVPATGEENVRWNSKC